MTLARVTAHFLPGLDTKKRAKLIAHNALILYSLLLFLTFVGIRVVTVRIPGVLGYASNINVSDLLKYTNDERKRNNLNELTLDPDLSRGAKLKAEDMFKNNYWAHVSPQGTEPWDFFQEVSYDYSYAGENLAKNFNDSKSVVKAWTNSPSHRENMLNQNYTDIGFAVVNGELDGYETTLVVQFFGKRRGFSLVPKVEPQGKKLAEEELGVSVLSPKEALAPAPQIDISLFTRTVSIVIASFILGLFTLDYWYSSKKGLVRFTGHTLAHIFILLLVVVSIGFIMVPGRIG